MFRVSPVGAAGVWFSLLHMECSGIACHSRAAALPEEHTNVLTNVRAHVLSPVQLSLPNTSLPPYTAGALPSRSHFPEERKKLLGMTVRNS